MKAFPEISFLFIAGLLILSSAGCQDLTPVSTATGLSPVFPITPTNTYTPVPSKTSTATYTPAPTVTLTYTPEPTPPGGGLGKVVFTSSESAAGEEITLDNIFVITFDGSSLNKLTDNTSNQVFYAHSKWSPDGSKILFTRYENLSGTSNRRDDLQSELFTMDNDGTDIQKISPAPASDGAGEGTLRIFDIEGDWSPDGQAVAFTSNRHSVSGQNDAEIFILDIHSSEIRQVTDGPGNSMHPSWSPDGEMLAFMSDEEGDWEINTIHPDGTNRMQLTHNQSTDRFPAWSHDGSTILFHSDRDGNIELYTISVAELQETRLTNNPAQDSSARWSPDDQWIVFISDRAGDYAVYVMKIDGSEIYKLYDGENSFEFSVDWSP